MGEAPNAITQGAEFQESPVARIYSTGRAIRRRLLDSPDDDDFAILRELRADGITDYLASPLHFSNGEIHVVTWTTRAAGGFTDQQIRALESVVAPFARVAEVWAVRRMATNLLDTYVGNQTGARILAGQIRRGDRRELLRRPARHHVHRFLDIRGLYPCRQPGEEIGRASCRERV